MNKSATTAHPVHDLIAQRWSPYRFAATEVGVEDLASVFEAARWAPSSYNEQPWSYIVAARNHDRAEFDRVLSCLVEPNQAWAQHAPVLALGVANLEFARNGKANAAALHDLGSASANLSFEATARGLVVHQMIGILPERAAEIFSIPETAQVLTGLAIGFAAGDDGSGSEFLERDQGVRSRKPLSEILFSGKWGQAADLF